MFAIDTESRSSEFYENAARNDRYERARESLLLFAEQNKKNKSVLEKMYKDSTASDGDVGAFAPIAGLRRGDYLVERQLTSDASYQDFVGLAMNIEEKVSKLYLDIAAQVSSQGTRIVRSFKSLAQGSFNRKLALESLMKDA